MSILAHNPLRCLSTVCNNFFPQTHTHIESVSHVWPYQHPINLQLYKCYGNSGRPILAPSPYLWVFVQLWYSLLQKRSMLPTDDSLLTRNLPIGDVLCTRDTIKISFPPTMLCCEWEWGPHLCSSFVTCCLGRSRPSLTAPRSSGPQRKRFIAPLRFFN